MQRYKITISYDGSSFNGWQLQPNGPSIQEEIEKVLARLTGETVRVHGSSRTDAGVHARKQVAHFDLNSHIDSSELKKGMNALLPSDIRIMQVTPVSSQFHARFNAVEKEYRYFIWNAEVLPPFLRLYRTHITRPLDIQTMRSACKQLVGKHDFSAFSANPERKVTSTIREIKELSVRKRGPEIVIIVRADGFLYRMVRSITGYLIRVGTGELPPSTAREILLSRNRTAVVPTAPPQGLFLWNIKYRYGK
jgi:tRNA pseudouridine38-40 synthase